MIDIFYHFDKSTKRKAELDDYCTFCNVEFRQVLKHVSTRWLSLELAVTQTLQQYPALRSYFLSDGTHSNAEEERVFSLVTKNKTKFRPNLKLDGTLSSILTIKLANTAPCQNYEPPTEVIESARKATMAYNRAHSSKHSM